MISLEVIQSLDPNYLGPRIYYKNSISLGNKQDDLPLLSLNHLSFLLSIENSKLRLTSLDQETYYHLNDKKNSGDQYLKPGDTLKINDHSIKIIHFENQEFADQESDIKNNLISLLQGDNQRVKETIQILEKDLRDLHD